MKKAPEAFRTISEVAEILGTPAHVLRFWESKFYQIRPVKRAGGRRYYRPDDVALINGIRFLLQEREMTIRGVQRVLQEDGVKHVAGLGGPLILGDPAEPVLEDEGRADADLDAAATDPIPVAEADVTSVARSPVTPPEMAASPVDSRVDPAGEADEQPVDETPGQPADALAPAAEAGSTPADAPDDTGVDRAVDAADPSPSAAQPASAEQPIEDSVMTEGETMTPDAPPLPAGRPKAPVGALAGAMSPRPEDAVDTGETSERAQIARQLRAMPRGRLGARRDRLDMLSRRIDTLLERMSEASGAGRW
ncbi:MAG: MerR family transcriptional regulator [Rhodobacteraceae bacterium]|nr:MerR family transcriptional regulator [Paracoccaceae bacterium]